MIYNNYTITLYELINNFFSREEIESWFTAYDLKDFITNDQIKTIESFGVWNKEKLAKKIVDHYMMEEIGFETPGLFKQRAEIKMKEIMESKLPLIYSMSIEYDPLINVDFEESFLRKIKEDSSNNGVSNSTSNSSGSDLNIFSNTPQGQINKSEILAGNYATNTSASENENTLTDKTTTDLSRNQKTNEEYTKRIRGNSGVSATAQKMIVQYRENIRAVDYEIIKELENLFMQIY